MTTRRQFFGRAVTLCCAVTGLGSLLAGCGGSNEGEVTRRETVTLRVGESQAVDAGSRGETVRLTLSQVTEDSRCGILEDCFWAGRFVVSATLTGGGGDEVSFTAQQGITQEVSASGSRPGYRVEITEVTPDKQTSAETIPQDQYRVTINIQRLR